MKWPLVTINTGSGPARAVAPSLLAVSRATDVPAFYMPWFMKRLQAGYACWINPFSGKPQYVSLGRARAVVFWSKNPESLIQYHTALEARSFAYYVQFTLNDYETEGWEPELPPISQRVETFRRLAGLLGPERVVWRFDPLMLAANPGSRMLTCEDLLRRLERLAQSLTGCTTKLVFSFADIAPYRKVAGNLRRKGVVWRDFTPDEMRHMGAAIADISARHGMRAFTCGEKTDLSAQGVAHNRCTDPELILRLTSRHPDILDLFGLAAAEQMALPGVPGAFGLPPGADYPRDPGQRAVCLCVPCKDVGQYNTCPHGCIYCYANTSEVAARKNFHEHNVEGESIAAMLGSFTGE